jgi:uncharacterized damage-inducible protein DinB
MNFHGKEYPMACQPYSQLVAYKQWADRSLYDVAGETLEHLDPQDATLLLRIFDHIHVVDRIFQHHLQGLPHGFQAPRSEQVPQFSALADSAREIDEWYVSYVRALTQSDFEQPIDFTFTSGKPARMRRGEILLHVCLHGHYHRGNAGALLQLRGFTPRGDGFADFVEQAIQTPAVDPR